MQFRMGAAMKFLDDKLLVSTEIAKIVDWESVYFNIGAEYTILDQYSIRAGLNDGRFTVGLGYTFDKIGVDYGTKSVSEFGFYHSFAVKYAFGGFEVSAKAFPDIFSPVGEQHNLR